MSWIRTYLKVPQREKPRVLYARSKISLCYGAKRREKKKKIAEEKERKRGERKREREREESGGR